MLPQPTAILSTIHALTHDTGIEKQAQRSQDTINATQRHPQALRAEESLRAASLAQAAQLAHAAGLLPKASPDILLSAYSYAIDPSSASTFYHAPAQALARIDLLLGGPGYPQTPIGEWLSCVCSPSARALPDIAYAPFIRYSLLAGNYCGERTPVLALIASRLAAMASGADPRGLSVPEAYYARHPQACLFEATGGASGGYEQGDGMPSVQDYMLSEFQAWSYGAELALRMAATMGGHKR